MANSLRNYNYLLACSNTKQALVIDPYDAKRCLTAANSKGWQIRYIVNTHEHWDHVQGNQSLATATGATIMALRQAQGKIEGVHQWLEANQLIQLGEQINLKVLYTPGHTFAHLCLLSRPNSASESPKLFCGDTLFNAGAGNCHSGNVHDLYQSFTQVISQLPDQTQVYPGHDYMENNLNFALDREPDNQTAKELLKQTQQQSPDQRTITNIALEKQINPFLRLNQISIYQHLKQRFANLSQQPEEIFTHLRLLRNEW
jgi:hydroxyacylglutathione hydrolase